MYPCLLLKVLACSEKRLLCCLCSCTLCEGIHAQVTSQRGSGAPGKREASHWWRYPLVRHSGGGNRIPVVLHTGEGYRNFSGILRTGEDNRKKNLLGLDPRMAQWLATLLRRLSMAKEMKITSFMEVNLMRRIIVISMSCTVSQLFSR